MCRCVEEDLVVDLGSKLKLCILNSLCVNWFEGRCWKVKEKSHRRALMMHRGGTAQRWDCTEVGLHRGGTAQRWTASVHSFTCSPSQSYYATL